MNTQIVDDSNRGIGYYPDVALDRDLTPIIAYYDQINGDLKFARLNRSTGFWDWEIVDEKGDVGLYPNLGIDRDSNPWILYHDNSSGGLKIAREIEGVWRITTEIHIPDYTLYGFLRARKDVNDGIFSAVVGLNRIRGTYDLLFIFIDLQTGIFTGNTILEDIRTPGLPSQIPQSTDIALLPHPDGSMGIAIPFYHQREEALYLAYDNNAPYTQWKVLRLAGTSSPADRDIGQYVSVVNEGDDLLHLSYYVSDHRTQKYLAYGLYRLSTAEFLSETVDSEGFVGEYSSIVLDRSLRPSISYYDSTNNDLKLAVRGGPNRWLIFRPDLVGVVGDNCRMLLLPDGQLGIAYRDQTREALKFTVVLSE